MAKQFNQGDITNDFFNPLIDYPTEFLALPGPRAPKRPCNLTNEEKKQAVRNVLRYVPKEHHSLLAKEFAAELEKYGHIYAYRFCPDFWIQAPELWGITARSKTCGAIILMILNNLDPKVAQFPRELVTYGGNGQVFSNWLQFRLVLRYLEDMANDQTLVLYSGHPLGVFPSSPSAPRMTITNGMMIPNYSTKELYNKFFAMGVTQYGQMTAGSFCYIGPQGIVHGTTITVMNAGRRYLGVESLAGKVFVTSGLGGMSGAQPKAGTIAGCIAVIAEINEDALRKRLEQKWLDEYTKDLDKLIEKIKLYRGMKIVVSIGYLGNVVDLWERLAAEDELLVELGSDQTSLHNPYLGGYYPAGLTFEESNVMMTANPAEFERQVQSSLRRQIGAIDKLAARGMYFWDYGNAFLVECQRAGVPMLKEGAKDDKTFRYPSYMQDIMGDIFSMGFGPFRWVCTSNKDECLKKSDEIAVKVFDELLKTDAPEPVKQQYRDNRKWISEADKHQLVVGTKVGNQFNSKHHDFVYRSRHAPSIQARILYSDQAGRVALALAFNAAVKSKEIDARSIFIIQPFPSNRVIVMMMSFQAPVVISRDHHDVSGTDSPFRETSNITDGSAFTADMAVQNVIGDACRGATWVSIHNGGGVGWGDVINGGFGMYLDGSESAEHKARSMLAWDVSNGVTRRAWAGNSNAIEAINRTMANSNGLKVTMPNIADDKLIDSLY
ncbi:hypothetical protein PRIPAC_77235 [Pristionchus pacificus]|uniref:urocanate hydratase n=1 Tax=Pristionchus pacificus TaxID=54126 RepID=A0A2A6CBD2_PRIPA|nr:hypothetical protein PRIPAC_77235 [Pristionchus pacificus]|eukprot:PDM75439.1 hypothetical protein PRIPAC_42616 [Pristionchus pacificus]